MFNVKKHNLIKLATQIYATLSRNFLVPPLPRPPLRRAGPAPAPATCSAAPAALPKHNKD